MTQRRPVSEWKCRRAGSPGGSVRLLQRGAEDFESAGFRGPAPGRLLRFYGGYLHHARWLDGGSWIGRSRRESPTRVIRTTQRPLTSTTVTSPRSFASSQTGSLGQDVRQAEMTSS